MKICIPIKLDEGLKSEVYDHFGSAPAFLIVDSETMETSSITNDNQHHQHGNCQPLKAISGHEVDAVIVGGIGGGALRKLEAANIKVYRSTGGTADAAVDLLKSGKLELCQLDHACAGHHH